MQSSFFMLICFTKFEMIFTILGLQKGTFLSQIYLKTYISKLVVRLFQNTKFYLYGRSLKQINDGPERSSRL